MKVNELMQSIGIDTSWYRVGYNQTRTIKRAGDREVIAYARGYNGVLMFFRKRGGLLCYNVNKIITGYRYLDNKAYVIPLDKGYNLIKRIQKENLAQVFLPKKIEEEIFNNIIVDSI